MDCLKLFAYNFCPKLQVLVQVVELGIVTVYKFAMDSSHSTVCMIGSWYVLECITRGGIYGARSCKFE